MTQVAHLASRRHSILFGVIVVAAAVAVAAPAIARRFDRPAIPAAVGIDTSSAHRVFAIATASAQQASLWTSNMTNGRRCVTLQLDTSATTAPMFTANGGGTCGTTLAPPADHPLLVRMSGIGEGVVVSGRAAPSVASIVLDSGGQTSSVSLQQGLFLTELPAMPPTGDKPTLVGYNRAGSEVGRVDLNNVVESATAR